MKSNLYRLLSAVIIIITLAQFAEATININSVTASSYFSSSYSPNNLINGSGINTSTGLHDTNYKNMWLSGQFDIIPSLIFDFGSCYRVTSTDIWQYNYQSFSNLLDRGTKEFDILSSINGVDYIPVASFILMKSPGGNIPSQLFYFNTDARYIKIQIQSNYGAAEFAGLSEVRFNGSVAPEPISSVLFIMGGALLAGRKFIRRKA